VDPVHKPRIQRPPNLLTTIFINFLFLIPPIFQRFSLNNTQSKNEWILNSDKISIIKKLPCRTRRMGSFSSIQSDNPDLADWTVHLKLDVQSAPPQGGELDAS
jgi:hypothetical protein